MNNRILTLAAVALGAASMYYLDPQQGRRRRAVVSDKVNSASHDAYEYACATTKRGTDRMRGTIARMRSRLTPSRPSTDDVVCARVRAQLGHVISHPKAVHVDVATGVARLQGHLLATERDAMLRAVAAVPGIERVDDQLVTHDSGEHIPELQGSGRSNRRRHSGMGKMVALTAMAAPVALLVGAARRIGAR